MNPLHRYQEIVPVAALAEVVECYWTLEVIEDHKHLVVPDGCLDLILFWRGREIEAANIVGTMTKPRLVSLSKGQCLSGVRFHPGVFSTVLQASIPDMVNQEVALDACSPSSANSLVQALRDVTSIDDCLARLEKVLHLRKNISPAQRAVCEMATHQGGHSISDGAAAASLSDRQFRRVCVRETGIAPKNLQRIIRFRQAWLMLRKIPECSIGELAAECGYSDQAHLIREFREFAGTTPGNYVKSLA